VKTLITHAQFRTQIASAYDYIIPTFNNGAWERLATMVLGALTIEDGGDEMQLAGAARVQLEQYLSDVQFVESIEAEPRQTLGNPTVIAGKFP
jgi:hypothetical protein